MNPKDHIKSIGSLSLYSFRASIIKDGRVKKEVMLIPKYILLSLNFKRLPIIEVLTTNHYASNRFQSINFCLLLKNLCH